MTKERIVEGILNLPTINVGTIANENEAIEGNQGSVHYIVTRERIHPSGLTVFALSCSGALRARTAFIEEMKREFGPPLWMEKSPLIANGHVVFWNPELVEERLRERD
jgi:hypothetical protein